MRNEISKISHNNYIKYDWYAELVTLFCNTTRKELDKMDKALKKDDFNLITNIAHKIKPNYYAVGLYKLYERADWIEKNINKDLNKVQKIEEFIYNSLDAIEELYSNSPKPSLISGKKE